MTGCCLHLIYGFKIHTTDTGQTETASEDVSAETKKSEEVFQGSVSVAYISETLIKQITKEEKLDLIVSLTIHFPKDKLNKKIKV